MMFNLYDLLFVNFFSMYRVRVIVMMFNLYDLLFLNFFSMYRVRVIVMNMEKKLTNNKLYKLNIITITLTLYMEKKLTNNKSYKLNIITITLTMTYCLLTSSPCIELGLSYDV
jgi:hypothetical protein